MKRTGGTVRRTTGKHPPLRLVRLGALLVAAALAAQFAIGAQALAQQEGPTAAEPEGTPAPLTTADVEALKARVTATPDLDEKTRQDALALYDQAIEQLEAARRWKEKAEESSLAVEQVPARLAAVLAEEIPAEAVVEVGEDASLEDLEQELARAEAKFAAARDELAAVTAQAQKRTERRAEVPALIAAAQGRLDSIAEEIAALASAESKPLTDAKRTLLQASRRAVEAEIDALEKEITSYTALGDLLTARKDLAARHLAYTEKLVKAWRDIVAERRRREVAAAARRAEEARRAFEVSDPALEKIAEKNAHYAERRRELAGKLHQVTEEISDASTILRNLDKNAEAVREKIDTAHKLTRPISVLLRKQRANLPGTRLYRARIQARQERIDDLELESLQLDDDRAEFADIDSMAGRIAGRIAAASPEVDREALEAQVLSLLRSTRDNLEALSADVDEYLSRLVDLDQEERRLVAETLQFQEYIEERIFWYHSTEAVGLRDLVETWQALVWLAAPFSWRDLFLGLADDARNHPLLYLFAVAGLAGLVLLRRRVAGVMRSLSEKVVTASTDSFGHTLTAFVLTVLCAAWWPLLLAFIGLRLWTAQEPLEFARAISVGLWTTALILATTEFLRLSSRENGLADAHFRWRRAALGVFQKNLRWFTFVILPVSFVVSLMNWQQVNEQWRESVARLFMIVGLVAVAAFIQRLLRPSGKLLEEIMRRRRGGWLERLHVVWYPLAVAVPLAIALGATLGYQYTAYRLALRLVYTLWLILALFYLNAFTLRWLFVAHRKLAVEKALKRRAAEEAPTEGAEAVEEPEIDIFSISAQTRKFIHSIVGVGFVLGLWLIWRDVLPALAFLDRVELWSAGDESAVTLSSFVTAAIVIIMTIVAARNIPGLLEISVLQRLPLDHGVRFAITSVARYIIIFVGIIISFAAIGIGWSKVQWLLAAMTVGIGFGLQEIFGNFISGLIILFERPMRVGDTVTIGNVTGTVTRIQIRATTIRDWDRKELVVPNKEFVTGQLVNWTLSDAILRIIIPVGIAYGSDTKKARELLLKVADENPNILDDPEPTALFLGFGNSALNFELRVFIPGIEHYLPVQHELHMAIDNAFREAGITIAFPQHDIHIKSTPNRLQPFEPAPDQETG